MLRSHCCLHMLTRINVYSFFHHGSYVALRLGTQKTDSRQDRDAPRWRPLQALSLEAVAALPLSGALSPFENPTFYPLLHSRSLFIFVHYLNPALSINSEHSVHPNDPFGPRVRPQQKKAYNHDVPYLVTQFLNSRRTIRVMQRAASGPYRKALPCSLLAPPQNNPNYSISFLVRE